MASAAKAPPDTGSLSCNFSATANLSVPYTYGGVPGTKKSVTTVTDQSFTACTGSGNSVTGGTPATATIKRTFAKNASPPPADCTAFVSDPGSATLPAFKEKVVWSDGTKSTIEFSGGVAGKSPPGFTLSGTVSAGSFADDTVTVTADLSGSTIGAIVTCASGGAPVPSLDIADTSTLTIS